MHDATDLIRVGNAACRREPPATAMVVGQVRIFREAIAAALEGCNDLSVVAVAATMEEARILARGATPDVVLVDVSSVGSGETVRSVARYAPVPRIVAVAVPDDEVTIMICVATGVTGFVEPDASVNQLRCATRAVADGDAVCPPFVSSTILRRAWGSAAGTTVRVPLTCRETEVLALLEIGMSNREIAAKLCIEVSTVKNHVHNLLSKLGARRRSEAVARARSRIAERTR